MNALNPIHFLAVLIHPLVQGTVIDNTANTRVLKLRSLAGAMNVSKADDKDSPSTESAAISVYFFPMLFRHHICMSDAEFIHQRNRHFFAGVMILKAELFLYPL